ncbi:MAG: hypothetical protein JW963_00765 [Anaerolineales bacterium]|nr:hypothetical protein [Anaerolineales bacterium]
MKQTKILTVILLLTFILASCSSGAIQTVEVTRLVPQTIEVTRIVQPTAITTPVAEPAILSPTESQPVQDSGYYDGIIVITQYYTFLGHGLYEEAYQLLSSSAQSPQGLEDYVTNKQIAFKTVEIIKIEPYYIAVENQGGEAKPDPVDKKRFTIQIKAWGQGNMSGSVESGSLQTLFLTLIQENGKWKIDSFSTAPFP